MKCFICGREGVIAKEGHAACPTCNGEYDYPRLTKEGGMIKRLWEMGNRKITIRWKRFLPLLFLNIEIPFIRIRTSVMYRCFESRIFDYVSVDVWIWRWSFSFALYDRDKGSLV